MIRNLERLKYLRILQDDGSYYGDIPLAIDAKNVSMQNKNNLQSTIGTIDYLTQGSITQNLNKLSRQINNCLTQIQVDKTLTEDDTPADAASVGKRFQTVEDEINSMGLNINDLGLYQDATTGFVYLTYQGQRGTQGIPLATLKSTINQNVDDYVDEKIDKIDKELPITVHIDSSAGNIFTNPQINTTLTATVYKGSTDITDQVSKFTWRKKDKNGFIDENWGTLMNGRTIIISPADVVSKAVFICEVEI